MEGKTGMDVISEQALVDVLRQFSYNQLPRLSCLRHYFVERERAYLNVLKVKKIDRNPKTLRETDEYQAANKIDEKIRAFCESRIRL